MPELVRCLNDFDEPTHQVGLEAGTLTQHLTYGLRRSASRSRRRTIFSNRAAGSPSSGDRPCPAAEGRTRPDPARAVFWIPTAAGRIRRSFKPATGGCLSPASRVPEVRPRNVRCFKHHRDDRQEGNTAVPGLMDFFRTPVTKRCSLRRSDAQCLTLKLALSWTAIRLTDSS